ncbi:spore germination protein [Carboxydochorda subterranea]|uniref:Spore germination protein n=1 Tax=Carboxydichorda subterranea TaxID=3109565 RepID=A0ABZ1BTS9_9FIRM|nr:spore germination protein [Limnochorda sp. L945t]WRP16035.1 spore germination protein [Limnochorda sp. L945t]
MRDTGRTNALTWLLRWIRAAPGGPPFWGAPATRLPGGAPAAGSPTEPGIVQTVRARLAEPPDLVVRAVDRAPTDGAPSAAARYWVLFLDSMVDATAVAQHIVGPLLRSDGYGPAAGPASSTQGRAAPGGATPRASLPAVYVPAVTPVDGVDEATGRLLDGWTILVDPEERLWAADTAARPGRVVEEPDAESGVRVPREGFNEQIGSSMALIRSRLRHPGLRFEEKRVGSRTATRVALVYIEDLINPAILDTVRSRLGRIQIDGVLESGYIEEFIEDQPFSPFPQTLRTERPDVVVGNLLEGHFAILVDGSPFALVGPVVLTQLLGVSEDYYERAVLSVGMRGLRFLALIISLVLPGLYVALLTYHQELLPTHLFLSIAAAREGVPFPAIAEALIMEVQFEILREAGLRLPRVVGPAISIVGALVLGQAAISANLVSPAMVIVVAMTAIASFATPVFSLALAARVTRFVFTMSGALLGLFGMQAVAVLLLVHLCALRSFGVPYLAPVAPLHLQDWKDVGLRLPWWAMRRRPGWLMPKELMRSRLPRGDHGS